MSQDVQILCEDNIIMYSNVYIDKQNRLGINVKMPTVETTITDNIGVTQSDLEDGHLFETDYFDLMKYKQMNNLNFSSD